MDIPGILVNRPDGALYLSVVFKEGRLNDRQTLPIANSNVRRLVEDLACAPNIQQDKRFVYYLLAATGICVVPLTSFSTALQGFRATLLEPDEVKFRNNIETLTQGIMQYMESGKAKTGCHTDSILPCTSFGLTGEPEVYASHRTLPLLKMTYQGKTSGLLPACWILFFYEVFQTVHVRSGLMFSPLLTQKPQMRVLLPENSDNSSHIHSFSQN